MQKIEQALRKADAAGNGGWFLHLITLHDVIRPREPLLRLDVDPAPYREDTRPGGLVSG